MSIINKVQKKHFFLLIVFLLASVNAFNQVKNLGLPYFENYTVDDYKAASKQNWMAAQDNRGVLYFGNNVGVLEYDGHDWNIIPLTSKARVVRALKVAKDGRIYVGSPAEFGYLKPDSIGQMSYVSLVDKIDNNALKKFSGINTIFEISEKIFFAGDDIIFEYSGSTVKGHKIEKLRQTAEVNGRVFMRISKKGLFEWKNEKLMLLPNGDDFKNSSLRAALPYGENIMIVTMEDGLFVYDGKKLVELKTDVDAFLKKTRIISAIRLSDGNYAFGMYSKGLVIISKEGKLLQHVDTKLGLQSDVITNILQSNDNNLWLSTFNGVCNMMTSLPLTTFKKNYDLNAAVYTSLLNNGFLYVGSSTGLHRKKWDTDKNNINNRVLFEQIGSPNNSWQLDTINNLLFIATNGGIKEINKNKVVKSELTDIGVWKILKISPDKAIVGTNEGLKLLSFRTKKKNKKSKDKSNWKFEREISGYKDECRHLEKDSENNFWISDKSKGVFKLAPNSDLDSVKVISYNRDKGLQDSLNNYLFKINHKIVIGTNNGLFYYDQEKDVFTSYEELNSLVGQDVKMWLMIEDHLGNIWYKQQRKIKHSGEDVFEMGQLILQDNGSYLNYKTPFYKFKNDIYSINPLKNGNVIIGTAKGFVHYDPKIDKDYSKSYNALIRKVEFIANDSLLFDGAFIDSAGLVGLNQKETQIYKFPYQFNDIRFTFSAPFFDKPDQILYKFYLEGNDDGWTDWKTKNFKEYSNLRWGDYAFRVKAKNIYEIESEEAVYRFTILPPWYWTAWAIAGYVVLGILLIWGIVRLSVRRLRKQKEHLEEVVEERTAEIRMKNTELEQQKEEILAQSDELEAQRDKLFETNEQLADKNKNITASITYAKRIQEAMLPLTNKIEQSFDDYFILFKPRDIVSGDFYWFAQKNNKTIFTAVDCTGHGVPGAFMSMIGSEILTTIVNQGITIPSEILDYKNRYIRKALKQEQTDNQDGMDMSLCTIDKQNKIIEWAGAKNPLVYIQNKELFHVKGDSQSIGGHQLVKKKRAEFANHEISYADTPTYFYIFTDGFQDQFGGSKNRKFMVKRMKELIYDNHQKPMKEQQKILNIAIETWMKDVEQTDDILVIGFKLSP